jgi:Papain fold toxin 1, glutamine deamidase
MNCVNCVVAVDNILGGGESQVALPNRMGSSIFELENLYGNSFVDAFSKEHIEILLEEAGTGSKGIVYGERAADHGHVFNVVNLEGRIIFIDGQSGKYANVKEFKNLAILRTN